MFGKKKGAGGAGHIKRNTQGTSNEISFSVLDAMKNSAEGEEQGEGSSLGRISLFTLGKGKEPPATPSKGAQITMPSSSGQARKASRHSSVPKGSGPSFSTGSITAEASIRKKHRKRSKRAVIAVGSLVALCVLFVIGMFAVNGIQNQMSQSDRMRLAIEDARTHIGSLDGFRSLLDASEQASLDQLANDDFVDRATSAVNEVPGAITKLRTAKTQIESLQEGLFSPIETENANQALSDINEYISMLEQGKDVLSQVSEVVKAYQDAQRYQSLLLEADALAREAIEVSSSSTDEGFNQALQKSREAFEGFAAARDIASSLGSQSNDLFQAAPINGLGAIQLMQPFVDYANLRVQAQEFAIAADEAFLAKNSARIIEANNSYNDLEARAAEIIAQQGGKLPADLIAEAFAQVRP